MQAASESPQSIHSGMTKNNHRHSRLFLFSKYPRHSRMPSAGIQEFNLINKITITVIFSLILIVLSSCSQNKEPPVKQITICPTNGEWCESTTEKNNIAILFPKKIPYLKLFPVQVKVKNKDTDIQKIQLQFSMQGMEMGTNSVTLKQHETNKNQWKSNIVLPICTSARKDWLINSIIKTDKNNFNAYFLISIE